MKGNDDSTCSTKNIENDIFDWKFIFSQNEIVRIPVEILNKASTFFQQLSNNGFCESSTFTIRPSIFNYYDFNALKEYIMYITIPSTIQQLFRLHFLCIYYEFSPPYLSALLNSYKNFNSSKIASILVNNPSIFKLIPFKNQLLTLVDYSILKSIFRIIRNIGNVHPSFLQEIFEFDGINCHETTVFMFVLEAVKAYPSYCNKFFSSIRLPFLSNVTLHALMNHPQCPNSLVEPIRKAIIRKFDDNVDCLRPRAGTVFAGSNILNSKHIPTMIDLVPGIIDWECTFSLEADHSKPNKTPIDFHRCIDDCGPSLLLMETDEGYIFGAFCVESWQSPENFTEIADPHCFLFSLRNFLGDYSCVFFQKSLSSTCLRHQKYLPPTYGNNMGCSDLFFQENLTSGYCYLGNSFAPSFGVIQQLYQDVNQKIMMLDKSDSFFKKKTLSLSNIFVSSDKDNTFKIKKLEMWLQRSHIQQKRKAYATDSFSLAPMVDNTSLVEDFSDVPTFNQSHNFTQNHNPTPGCVSRIRTFNDVDTASLNEPLIKDYYSDLESPPYVL
eukprot:TRINITY_DN1178_c0_g1_i1.p1 TRINITY_DN1178_c0_g1~~TRINITY_DN1178_c0_g1_i1.p1  ORF type:complete len:553 (-),score=104.81 TRINITY_DN1178_c0_g1_i1:76-1734(-)